MKKTTGPPCVWLYCSIDSGDTSPPSTGIIKPWVTTILQTKINNNKGHQSKVSVNIYRLIRNGGRVNIRVGRG